jgi:Icc-related predicted phosphoesterase
MALKIVAISDTHNAHDKVIIPPCDILIHAGDESYKGTEKEVRTFARWFEKQPAKHLIWIPGNHSLGVEANWPLSSNWVQEESFRTHILMNSDVTVEGIKIWGSPVTPWFHDWAWNVVRGERIKKYWDAIPDDTSIVVTHGPPYGILDIVRPGTLYEEHVGCEELLKAMLRVKPKYNIFGHIHEGYGEEHFAGIHFINASIMTEDYEPVNKPIEIEL